MNQHRVTRYRGTSPFQDTRLDRKILFGREVEKRSLLSLLLSEDLVVVFARSGMGKTSLINAGLFGPLRERGFYPIVARLNRPQDTLRDAILDGVERARTVFAADQVGGGGEDAWEFFDSVEFWTAGDDLLTPVLVLDQFEELFTLRSLEQRREISRQLRDLVRGRTVPGAGLKRPRLKVLLSLREDFLAELEALSAEIPGVLRNRFRLGALTTEGARDAIERTAAVEDDELDTQPFEFSSDALDRIVDFLSEKRIGHRTITTDEVEPVLLQLICQHVEHDLIPGARADAKAAGRPEERIVVTAGDLGPPGHLRNVLEGFYERTIKAIRPRSVARSVRKLCEHRLISGSGRRLSEDEDEIADKFHIPSAQLASLVDARLLRAEPRLGGTSYELSHDSLIAPITQSRERRESRARRTMFGGGVFVLVAGVAAAFIAGGSPEEDPLDSAEVGMILFSPEVEPESRDSVLEMLEAIREGDFDLTPASPGSDRAVESIQRLLLFLGYPTGPNGTSEVSLELGAGTALGLELFRLERGLTPGDSLAVPEEPRVDGEVLEALVDAVVDNIAAERFLMGGFEEAVLNLNEVTSSTTLGPTQLTERYGEVAVVVAETERLHPDWLLAIVGSETQGVLKPRFEADVYGWLASDSTIGLSERRLGATRMTLGRIPGDDYPLVSADSAADLMFAPIDSQFTYLARYLNSDPLAEAWADSTNPSDAGISAFHRAYTGGQGGLAGLASWFRDVQDTRTADVVEIELNLGNATLLPGERITVRARLIDEHGDELADRQLRWESDTPGVAVVDGSGAVTARSSGQATVWAQVLNTRSDSLVVTVRSHKVGIYFDAADSVQQRAAQDILDGLLGVGYNYVELYPRDAYWMNVTAGRAARYEIRYEAPEEEAEFQNVRGLLQDALPGLVFEGRPVPTATPNFLSVFVPDLSAMTRVDALDGEERTTRRRNVQELIDRFGGDPATIAEALRRLEGNRERGPLSELSPAGIVNVLTYLGATEADAWTEQLIDRGVATVRRLAEVRLGPDARTALDNLTLHVRAIQER